MGSKALTDEEKAKFEKELIDFISQKIKNVGGSLQFQHLNNLSNQLSFETKNAVASNKVQLMKFLRSHPKQFKIDSKGIVSIVENPSSDPDYQSEKANIPDEQDHLLPQYIENGTGIISKIHAESGYIKATEPFETKVYFRASSFSSQFCLIPDLDVTIGTEVSFNAVTGLRDSVAPYRASKVWLKEDPSRYNDKMKEDSLKELNGEGCVQKLFPEFGFISVSGQMNSSVRFSKYILPNASNISELADKFKIGDHVIFTAVESSEKNSKAEWEATSVEKLEHYDNGDLDECNENIKYGKQQTNCMEEKYLNKRKDMIKNEHGKISPLKSGANILFGKDFTNIASARDSCVFFLYGSQVSEIAWEFSDGDDVLFDAVKINADPGWRAVIVWVGERPDFVLATDLGDFSEFADEDEEQDTSVLKTANSYNSNQLARKQHNKVYPAQSCNLRENVFEQSNQRCEPKSKHNRNKSSSEGNHKTKEFESEMNDFHPNLTSHVFKKNLKDRKSKIRGSFKNNDKVKKNDSYSLNHQHTLSNDDEYFSAASDHYTEKKSFRDRNLRKSPRNGSKQQFLRSFKSNSDEDTDNIQQRRKFLVPVEDNETIYTSDDCKESCDIKEKLQRAASIKLHKSINCEIVRVHCKVAFAKNPSLQNPVDFVSNAFYIDGCSADEQQIDDLREVLDVGKIVKLNCFEIVDDFGKHHQKVTMAWLGEEPQISEMTPQDFIYENDLSVTIDDTTYVQDSSTLEDSKKILHTADSSDSDDHIEATVPISRSSSSEESLSKGYKTYAPKLEPPKKPMDFQLLSEKITLKLGEQGLLSYSEVDLDNLSTEIVDLILKMNQGEKLSICTQCCKTLSHESTNQTSSTKAVQTIITGTIVAQSIFTKT